MSVPVKRMTADERREQILVAATDVFGAVGIEGGTTDAVARAAGISQAYVVRTFGSKEALVLAVGDRACERVSAAFRAVIATFTGDESQHERHLLMGAAYKGLMMQRGLMVSLMHIFAAGHDPVIGPMARERFLEVYRIVRDEAGFDRDEAMAFIAHGMLIDTIMALRLHEMDDPGAQELTACALAVDVAQLGEVKGVLGKASDFAVKR